MDAVVASSTSMDAEAVATLSAITGLPTAEAEGFLEMGALCAAALRLLPSLCARML